MLAFTRGNAIRGIAEQTASTTKSCPMSWCPDVTYEVRWFQMSTVLANSASSVHPKFNSDFAAKEALSGLKRLKKGRNTCPVLSASLLNEIIGFKATWKDMVYGTPGSRCKYISSGISRSGVLGRFSFVHYPTDHRWCRKSCELTRVGSVKWLSFVSIHPIGFKQTFLVSLSLSSSIWCAHFSHVLTPFWQL